MNGKRLDNANGFRNRIAATLPGSEVTLTLLRDTREKQVQARLVELSADKESITAGGGTDGHREQPGMTVEPLSPQRATRLGIHRAIQGVLITDVDPSGAGAEAGLQMDDVITEVNRQTVRSASDLCASLRRSGSRPALLLVNRSGKNLFLAVQPR